MTPLYAMSPSGPELSQRALRRRLRERGVQIVTLPAGGATHVYYCEPASGRCSCGVPSGSCSHIAAAISLSEVPRHRRRGE